MSAWLTLLKAVAPYAADIVADRLPQFTKRKEEGRNATDVMAQQISELQQAAQHNAGSIKALAEQLQQTVKAVEAGAIEHERAIAELKQQLAQVEQQRDSAVNDRDLMRRRIESARWVSLIAFGTAFLAISLAVFSSFV